MKEKKTAELAFSIAWSLVFLVAINLAPVWQPFTRGVVLTSFFAALWALSLSTIVQIVGNVCLVFYRPPRFNAIVQLFITASSLVAMIVFFLLFPLDFGAIGLAWINSVLRIVFIVGMCGAGIAVIVELVQLGTQWNKLEYSAK